MTLLPIPLNGVSIHHPGMAGHQAGRHSMTIRIEDESARNLDEFGYNKVLKRYTDRRAKSHVVWFYFAETARKFYRSSRGGHLLKKKRKQHFFLFISLHIALAGWWLVGLSRSPQYRSKLINYCEIYFLLPLADNLAINFKVCRACHLSCLGMAQRETHRLLCGETYLLHNTRIRHPDYSPSNFESHKNQSNAFLYSGKLFADRMWDM